MADNIKLRKPNFTTLDGYYFTFDEDQDALLQKTDDGNTAFSYPLDTLLTKTIQCLEYDGVYFWTLEDGGTNEVVIKRWIIANYVCSLQETFTFSPDASHNYAVDTFTVEHYHTEFTTTASGGTSTLYLDNYSNKPSLITGATLHLGPNTNGEEEDVTVTGTIFGGVDLTAPTTYQYASGDPVNFHKYLWLFNNYNGLSTATGALYKFNSHTGAYIGKYSGGQYKDIGASTFYNVDSFIEYGAVDTLAYIKGTNTLFVDVSEESANIQDASDLNDSFTGTPGDPPDPARWDLREGNPQIQSNRLYTSTTNETDSVTSDYFLRGNFEFTVDCIISASPTYSGSAHAVQFAGLLFPDESDRYCYIARGNNTEIGGYEGQQSFHVVTSKATTTVPAMSTSDIVDIFSLKVSRVSENISFYYKTTATGTWTFLSTEEMFTSDCKVYLGNNNTTGSTLTATFDDLTYFSGDAVYFTTATALPFYGSMVMENIQSDEVTVIPVYDLAMAGGNVYRLQLIEDGGGSWSTYNYQLSSLDAFVTSISLAADPAIIAANGLSTATITAIVKDQFLQPIAGRRVTFSENGTGSITGGTQINTNSDGLAGTVYTAGTTAQEVTITAVVEQTN